MRSDTIRIFVVSNVISHITLNADEMQYIHINNKHINYLDALVFSQV